MGEGPSRGEGPAVRRMPYALRPMEERDISQVASIEREAFPGFWPSTSFRGELRNPIARYLVAYERREGEAPPLPASPSPWHRFLRWMRLLWLGQAEGPSGPRDTVVGYVGLWFMGDEAHIVSIAVPHSHRGKGVGELLLIGAIELALRRGARVVTLEVRVSNTVAQALYRKYGFKEAGVRKGYYADNNEDALVMTTDPLQDPSFQALFQQRLKEHRERWGSSLRVVGPD